MSEVSPTIKNIGEMAYDMAREMMLDKGGVAPCFLIYKGRGLIALHAEFRTPEEKYKASGFATMIAGVFNADAIVFVSEAWLVKTDIPKDTKPEDVRVEESLATHPDREEMLMLMIYTKIGGVQIGGGEIKRTESNRAYAGELKWQKFDASSNHTALFKPWGTPEAQEFFNIFKSNLPDFVKEVLESVEQELDDGQRISDFDMSKIAKGVVVDTVGGSA